MARFSLWQSSSAAFAALGVLSGAATPLIAIAPVAAQQQANFTDVGFSYWARPFIQRLAEENIIAGFPDGSFKPDQPVTRAQFAAIVQNAFDQPVTRSAPSFPDVPGNYWAQNAIQNAYSTGFLSGYPNGEFQPNQEIPRVQVLVSLANGLDFSTNTSSVNSILDTYQDEGQIPGYAQDEVAAATQEGIVVNYPNIDLLNPQRVATRADVAAFIYQALVAQGQLPAVEANSNVAEYIVGYNASTPPGQNPTTPEEQNPNFRVDTDTVINVRYPNAPNDDISLIAAPGQTVAVTLEVANALTNDRGQVLVPEGSLIQGRLVPVNIQGSNITAARFVADRLVVDETVYTIQAESDPIAATRNVNQTSVQGAIITSAAENILGPLLGNRELGGLIGEVIGGSGNATTNNAVIVVNPNQLDLMITSPFYVSER